MEGFEGDRVLSAPKRERQNSRPRVVRIFDENATTWDYTTQPYIRWINYKRVTKMLDEGLLALTGAGTPQEAWSIILSSYRSGEKIAVKPNVGNAHVGYSEVLMTSPQVVAALIESLVLAGIPPEDIVVYDLTATESHEILPWINRWPIQKVWRPEYRNILDKVLSRLRLIPSAPDRNASIKMRSGIRDADGEPVACLIPKILTGAKHLINVPVFKGHQFVLQSSVLKNHFGTVRFSNFNSYPTVLHGHNIEKNIVDINNNDHIRLKTRLTIVDALFGAGCFTREGFNRLPTVWKTLTTGRTPNSLFLSFDPVALESVVADYVIKEQKAHGFEPYSHHYLHDAEDLGLGIHEHCDLKGKYSHIQYDEIRL